MIMGNSDNPGHLGNELILVLNKELIFFIIDLAT